MTLEERVDLYHHTFPNYPVMWFDKGWLMGVWVLGNMYKRPHPEYYGAYPGNYLKRLKSLFPDKQSTCHLFSGTLQAQSGEVTVDLNATYNPTVVADVNVLPFGANSFDLLVADPPYSAKDAENYGTPMVCRGKVMRSVRTVLCTGGHLCWLDTVRPMYSSKMWKQVGAVAVLVSTNTRTRCLSIFEAV